MLKQLIWIGSSRSDLKTFPEAVQDAMGYALYQAQMGYFPDNAKILKGFSGAIEIVEDFNKCAYRIIYTTKLGQDIYVLHAFQKKSKRGIKTPKEEIAVISKRLQFIKQRT